MGRGGKTKDRPRTIERRCLVTRETYPKACLIRFVLDPNGHVTPDVVGKLPGRGVYVCACQNLLQKAMSNGLFSWGFKKAAIVPDGLIELIDKSLVRYIIELISLARKSGNAVAGFQKVKAWMSRENCFVFLQASDSSKRGKTKLQPQNVQCIINSLSSQELGLAFGREYVVNVALSTGKLSQTILENTKRLKGVRQITSNSTRFKRENELNER
ncbi:MAG: RNA-binding protein [Aestuariivita sp.]|nr:RNA-binding protein [Aestuariivita sp.]